MSSGHCRQQVRQLNQGFAISIPPPVLFDNAPWINSPSSSHCRPLIITASSSSAASICTGTHFRPMVLASGLLTTMPALLLEQLGQQKSSTPHRNMVGIDYAAKAARYSLGMASPQQIEELSHKLSLQKSPDGQPGQKLDNMAWHTNTNNKQHILGIQPLGASIDMSHVSALVRSCLTSLLLNSSKAARPGHINRR